jgi:hypothetical protein
MLLTLEDDTECTAIGMQVPRVRSSRRDIVRAARISGRKLTRPPTRRARVVVAPQVQFISYFVQPIWLALEKVLPEIHESNTTIAANLEQFKELHAQLLAERAAARSPES